MSESLGTRHGTRTERSDGLLLRGPVSKSAFGTINALFGLSSTLPPFGRANAQFTASVPTLFNPTSLITGNGGFYRADVGVTGNPNVTAWADQSTFAQNLGTVSSTKPTWSATGFNTSFAGISFLSGNSTFIASSSGFQLSATTVSFFVLLSQTSFATAGNNLRLLSLQTGTDDIGAPDFCTFYNNGTPDQMGVYSGGFIGSGGGSYTTITAGVPLLWGGVFDGTHFTIWVNGTPQTANQSSFNLTIGQNTNQVIALGGQSVAGINFDTCTIAFAGITQKAMNSTDWTNLKTWSNSNWGTSF